MAEINHQRKGIFLAILSSLFFAVRACMIKSTPIGKVETLMALRFICDLLLLLPLFLKYRQHLKTKRFSFYFGRSLLVATSIYCSIYGIRNLALMDAMLLQYTLPLFIPLMLWIFHRKKISMRSFCLLGIGFISVFFLLKPQLDLLHLASLASLSVGILSAIMAVTLHDLTKTDHVVAILFHSTLLSGIFSIIPCLSTWETVPTAVLLKYIVPISAIGLVHQYLITRAYTFASPHIVGGFIYFCVLFSALFGWLIWDDRPDPIKIGGGILLIICGLLMVRENSRKIEPKVLLDSERSSS